MFDPHTSELIRSAPALRDLDLQRLPHQLTRAFAAIVTCRVAMGQTRGPLPDWLVKQLDIFRRLANTFESLVILLPMRENRSAAAYVAAQVHHLLYMAKQLENGDVTVLRQLRPDAISPVVSALLLFLIADQPSDAMELAKVLRREAQPANHIESNLVEALALLAEGKPHSILDLSTPDTLWQDQEDVEDVAVQDLFGRILEGVRLLAGSLVNGASSAIGAETSEDIFKQVQNLAVAELQPTPSFLRLENAAFHPLATYPGPHHLAALLIPAAARLQECATSNVPVPPGTNPTLWAQLLKTLIGKRPFLWRNHRDAIAQGLLDPGTSAVVSFPTGAGKTTLSELKVASTLAAGGAVLYLAPTHALVSQVKRSFQQTFPGVTVGDSLVAEDFYVEIGEDSLAEVAVMTPERCLALLSVMPQMFQRVRLVVFDECHLLHPQASGRTRRSVDAMLTVLHLSRVAPETDWLLLSAMMSNAMELAGWLSEMTTRKCLALEVDWKPTRQARGCLVFEQTELDRLRGLARAEQSKMPTPKGKLPGPPRSVQSLFRAKPFSFFCLEQTWQSTKVSDYALIPLLDETVSFSVSKQPSKGRFPEHWQLNPNKTEMAAHLAAACALQGLQVLLFGQTIDTTAKLALLVEQRLNPHIISDEMTEAEKAAVPLPHVQVDRLDGEEADLWKWAKLEVGEEIANYLISSRVTGCHHGEMLPVEREIVERSFRERNGVRVLAATTTLAQGVNLPADVVFIVGDARWDAKHKKNTMLEAHELLNAAGRAGRAGQVAQGLVVVLPNFLVGFDPKTNRIEEGWRRLRAGIFSKPDQCLRIQDPLEAILDILQVSSQPPAPDLLYFLRRLPPPTPEDPTAPATFLSSSLAAYHARRTNTEALFQAKLTAALRQQETSLKMPEGHAWQFELAGRAGVATNVIIDLDRDLLAMRAALPTTVEEWLRWFCKWLTRSPERTVMLRNGIVLTEQDSNQPEMFGGRLFDLTWAWMSGESLRSLQVRLGGKQGHLGRCSDARNFVLRQIPDIAYAVGLVTQAYREQIERGISNGKMPITLATISLCVRNGQSSPEELAARFELKTPYIARLSVKAVWSHVSAAAEPGADDEPFARTRQRVATALSWIEPVCLRQLLVNPEPNDIESDDEMPWDTAAREAVELALETARWDKKARTITLFDPDDDRVRSTVSSRKELKDYLAEVATNAFCATCSRDEGEYVSTCDEEGIVESALSPLDKHLESFFREPAGGNQESTV